MFQGHYCYPLTPPPKDSNPGELDQLTCIVNKIGVLSDDDKAFLTNEDALLYCSKQKGDKECQSKF
jgi:hypothetical protein